jgi:hypothetical protein
MSTEWNPRIGRQERQIDEIGSPVCRQPPGSVKPEQDLDDVAEASVGSRRGSRAFLLRKHDLVQQRRWHRKDDGVARVIIAGRASDQNASIDLFDGGGRRTKPDRNAVVAALRCEKFDEGAVPTDDTSLRMISANHPLVAKRLDAGALRHPLNGTPQRAV